MLNKIKSAVAVIVIITVPTAAMFGVMGAIAYSIQGNEIQQQQLRQVPTRMVNFEYK